MNGEAVTLNMYQTLGIAVLVLLLGKNKKKRIPILEKFCIPSPVIGGLLYAGVMTVLYAFDVLDANYDDTLKNLCMVIFFTFLQSIKTNALKNPTYFLAQKPLRG